jgi:clan AA aspartic protease
VITGRVFHRRPTVAIVVHGPGGQRRDLTVIVDTGFTGFLTLPPREVRRLGLPFLNYHTAVIADGRRVRLAVHEATILWHGAHRTVFVLATGREPLLGMSLVYGSRLTIEGVDGGSLLLEELP